MTRMNRLVELVEDGDRETLQKRLGRREPTNVELVEPLHAALKQNDPSTIECLLGFVRADVLSEQSILAEPLKEALPAVASTAPEIAIELAGHFQHPPTLVEIGQVFAHNDQHERITELINEPPIGRRSQEACRKLLQKEPTVSVLDAYRDIELDWGSSSELIKAIANEQTLQQNPVELVRAICDRFGVPASQSGATAARALRFGAPEVADVIFSRFDNARSAFKGNVDELKDGIRENDLSTQDLVNALWVVYEHGMVFDDKRIISLVINELAEHQDKNELVDELLGHYANNTGEGEPRLTTGRQVRALFKHGYDPEVIEHYLERLSGGTSLSSEKTVDQLIQHHDPERAFELLLQHDAGDRAIKTAFAHPDAPWSNDVERLVGRLSDQCLDRLVESVLGSSDPVDGRLDALLESEAVRERDYEPDQLLSWLLDVRRVADEDEAIAEALRTLHEHGVELSVAGTIGSGALRAEYDETIAVLRKHLSPEEFDKTEFKLRMRRGADEDAAFLREYLKDGRDLPQNVDLNKALNIDSMLAAELIERGVTVRSTALRIALEEGGKVLEAIHEHAELDDKALVRAFRNLVEHDGADPGKRDRALARLLEFDVPFDDPPMIYTSDADGIDEPLLVDLAGKVAYKQDWEPYCEYMRAILQEGADPNVNDSEAMRVALDRQCRPVMEILFEYGFDPNKDGAHQLFSELLNTCIEDGDYDRFELDALRGFLEAGGTLPAEAMQKLPANSRLEEELKPYMNRRERNFSEVSN